MKGLFTPQQVPSVASSVTGFSESLIWLSNGIEHRTNLANQATLPWYGLLEPACGIPPCHLSQGCPTCCSQSHRYAAMEGGWSRASSASPWLFCCPIGCGTCGVVQSHHLRLKQLLRRVLQRADIPSAALLASSSLPAVPDVAYFKAAISMWFSVA